MLLFLRTCYYAHVIFTYMLSLRTCYLYVHVIIFLQARTCYPKSTCVNLSPSTVYIEVQ